MVVNQDGDFGSRIAQNGFRAMQSSGVTSWLKWWAV
jgi:hypothetical protein